MAASAAVQSGGTKVLPAPDTSAQTKLVMFASPVRRLDDPLDTTHNRVVTQAVADALAAFDGAPPGEISAYAQDGVLAAFDVGHMQLAMSCADDAMRALRNLARDGGYEIECRIGLSVGEIVSVQYADGAPLDRVGPPVEIATRLVSDIAKPGQIVVDQQAQCECKKARLEALLPKLRPVQGQKLTIAGLSESIPVFELVWDGTEREIRNQRQLLRELTALQQVTFLLRLAVEEERPLFDQLRGENEKLDMIWRKIGQLDPEEEPDGLLRKLKDSWAKAPEAQRIPKLDDRQRRIFERYAHVRDSWDHNRPKMRPGSGDRQRATSDFSDAYGQLVFAVTRFLNGVNASLKEIEARQ
jgi:class 3 adenylate cyclase